MTISKNTQCFIEIVTILLIPQKSERIRESTLKSIYFNTCLFPADIERSHLFPHKLVSNSLLKSLVSESGDVKCFPPCDSLSISSVMESISAKLSL